MLKSRRRRQQIVGYTSGVFDLFHIGHLNLLRNAKSLCDVLIVAVSTDDCVQSYKNRLPVIPFSERSEVVRALRVVDVVVPQHTVSKVEACEKLKFDRLFVGDDWYLDASWSVYEANLRTLGAEVIYLPYTRGTSSTKVNQLIELQIDSYKYRAE